MTVRAHLYDYPQYYDLAFGSEWQAELNFLLRCFKTHAARRVRHVFEPACGTGRLLFRLAHTGLQVGGLDTNEHAVRYCNDRLERHGFWRSAFVGDMTNFRLERHADSAFNMINSFRHLTSGRAAIAHLQNVAAALRVGGVYVVGLHLMPTVGEPMQRESWLGQRGQLRVKTHMWTIDRDPHRRVERVGFSYHVRTPTRKFRLADEIVFRTYTASQFTRLLRDISVFEIAGIYDFGYDVDTPIELGPETEDAVFVLRKRRTDSSA